MSGVVVPPTAIPYERVAAAFGRRRAPGEALGRAADLITRACHDIAARFRDGGRLIVFGAGGPSTDAQHVAVEFVHPVLVGKPALPAVSLTNDIGTVTGIAEREGLQEIFAYQLSIIATPVDIALGISSQSRSPAVARGLEVARQMGLLTVELAGDGRDSPGPHDVDHLLLAESDDPYVVKEIHVTIYHLLWELVHVFLAHPGSLRPSGGGT
jgi:D-sedoheptulose 7-phosphate isomerase